MLVDHNHDTLTPTTIPPAMSEVIARLKHVAAYCSWCGEGEYIGAMCALNEVEELIGVPRTENVDGK